MTPHIPKWQLITIGLTGCLVALYFYWAQEFIAMDRCLDAGGAYNTAAQVCEPGER